MTKSRILIVDDDREMRVSLAHLLQSAGYEVAFAKDGQEGLDTVQSLRPDVILSDVRMPVMDGLTFQRKVRDINNAPVILVSAHGDIPTAVSALQEGAYSFVEKPFEPRRLLTILHNAVRMKKLLDGAEMLQDRLVELTDLERILIGTSPPIKSVRDQIFDFAVSKANVLVLGETGSGKELVARALHDLGSARSAPFVPVNCAAIPAEKFEETVFGTLDAPNGLLRAADGGTLFLDELGAMPFATQAKLLRVIETKHFQMVGTPETQSVDFRVISATSEDVSLSVANRTFREDLLFRLNTLVITLPKLSERGEDVLLLFRHYAGRLAELYDISAPELTPDDIAALLSHRWPGNVRELQNVAERHVLSLRRGAGSVRSALTPATEQPPVPETLREAVAAFERELIGRAIQDEHGRMDDVAARLGIGRRTLNEKIVKLGLDKAAILRGI